MWSRFWAAARIDLRLSDAEFFALTPRQFDTLCKRQRQREEREREHTEFMFGQLTSWVVNTGFRSTEKPTKPSDFMPSARGVTEQAASREKTRVRSPEDMVSELRLIFPVDYRTEGMVTWTGSA